MKHTPASAGCLNATSPNCLPPAGTKCTASVGTPGFVQQADGKRRDQAASIRQAWPLRVLPATSAAVTWPMKMASGKFHGLMQANTPRPRKLSLLSSPVGPGSTVGSAN